MQRKRPLIKLHGVFINVSKVSGLKDTLARFNRQMDKLETVCDETSFRISNLKRRETKYKSNLHVKLYSLKAAILSIKWKQAMEILSRSRLLSLNQAQIKTLNDSVKSIESEFNSVHALLLDEKAKPKIKSF